MAKFRSIKNSFGSGEISPTAMGRTDVKEYAQACKKLTNMLPYPTGGVYKRPGTMFDSDNPEPPALVPFVRSLEEPYLLMFGDLTGGGQGRVIRSTSEFDPGEECTVDGEVPLVNGSYNYAQSADTMWMVGQGLPPMIIRNSGRALKTGTDRFTISPVQATAQLGSLYGAALRDSIPYQKQNTTGVTITCSSLAGATERTDIASGTTVTLTASAYIFKRNVDNGYIKINATGSTIGCFRIISYTGSVDPQNPSMYNGATAELIVNPGATTATANWWWSSWSGTRGWPRTVCFHQDRILFGGNDEEPDSIWCSKTSNYFEMSNAHIKSTTTPLRLPNSDPLGEQPFQITVLSQQLNTVQWMISSGNLLVGTGVDEFEISNGTAGFACNGLNGSAEGAQAKVASRNGSCYIPAQIANSEVIFCDRAFKKIKALVFNDNEKSYQATPIQLMADHYPKLFGPAKGQLKQMLWDNSRSCLWCLDEAGNVYVIARDRVTQQVALHSMDFSSGDPYAKVYSIAILPNVENQFNDVYLSIGRFVNGGQVYYVERMVGAWCDWSTVADFQYAPINYTDCATRVTGDSSTTLAHLKDATVYYQSYDPEETGFNKGLFYGSAHVNASTGAVESTKWVDGFWGLQFTSFVEPVRPEAGSQIGTAQGAVKRIHQTVTRFEKTMQAKIGRDSSHMEEIIFRDPNTPIGLSGEIYTGDKLTYIDSDYDRDAYVTIQSDKPLPFSVISIISEGVTND